MNLKQIEYFLRVAEQASFSKAAQTLGVAQPALSRQIRSLEVELGQSLLRRTGRGAVPTEAGSRLLKHSYKIAAQFAAAREDLSERRDEPTGEVIVGLPPSLARQLTLPLVEHFRENLGKARLVINEGFSANTLEWLSSHRIDIALVYNPEQSATIDFKPLRQEELCLIGTEKPNNPLRFIELVDYPLILPQRGHNFRRILETHAAQMGIRLHVAWEVSSVPAILDVVAAGIGFAALTASSVKHHAAQASLHTSPLTDPKICNTLCLAQLKSQRRTPLVNHTVELLSDWLTLG